jgi:hypothetical protein
VATTGSAAPPSAGTMKMSRVPFRNEWKAISFPSGDQAGEKSSCGPEVSCSGSPPASGIL